MKRCHDGHDSVTIGWNLRHLNGGVCEALTTSVCVSGVVHPAGQGTNRIDTAGLSIGQKRAWNRGVCLCNRVQAMQGFSVRSQVPCLGWVRFDV